MNFTPKPLSQRNPLWKDLPLGFDNLITIGTDGCALACLAMLVNGHGYDETPESLNQKLKALGSGAGFICGLIVWESLTRVFPEIIYQRITIWDNPPALLDSLDTSIAAGQPVVVEIDQSPAPGLQNHWVLLYGKQGNDYMMLDPWPFPSDEQPVTLVNRYGLGRPPQDFIAAAVWYKVEGINPPSLPPSGSGYYVLVPMGLVAGLHLRSTASIKGELIVNEPAGTWLKALEPATVAFAKIGMQDQWLNVQDPQGNKGYVAAWYVQDSGQPVPTDQPVATPAISPNVHSFSATNTGTTFSTGENSPVAPALTVLVSKQASAGLRMRDKPNATSNIFAAVMPGTPLTVLESAKVAKLKVGVQGKWLKVKEPGGQIGYVAAWLVVLKSSSTHGQTTASNAGTSSLEETTPDSIPTSQELTVLVTSRASAGLRMRDQPNTNSDILMVLMPGTKLKVLETTSIAKAKIGITGQWLYISEPGGKCGYVAAWFVQ